MDEVAVASIVTVHVAKIQNKNKLEYESCSVTFRVDSLYGLKICFYCALDPGLARIVSTFLPRALSSMASVTSRGFCMLVVSAEFYC